MKKLRYLPMGLILGAFILLTPGCAGDPQSLLMDHLWTFEDFTTDSEDENVQSLVAFAKAFLTDATLEFQDGGVYILASPLSETPSTGTWELIGEDQLIMDPDGEDTASTGNIEVLTKNQLSYIETFTDEDSNTYTTTTTWVKAD